MIGADRAARDCVCVCAHRENDGRTTDGGRECRSSVRSLTEAVPYSAGCSFDLI